MKIGRICAVYFSAAGTTKQITEALAHTMASHLGVRAEIFDFTLPAARQGQYAFFEDDLVVFGMPTYAGRLPNKLLPYVQSGFSGGGALAIPVVCFGNRSCDSSLTELRNTLEENGFHTIAAAAFAVRHVFSDTLAAGRPDARDMELLSWFAEQASQKAEAAAKAASSKAGYPAPIAIRGDAPVQPYYSPRGLDGSPAVFLKAKPVTDPDRCNGCGLCAAVCPMGSVSCEDPKQIPGICIKCHACIRKCPQHAKSIEDPAFLSHKAMLERDFLRRAEPELFL